MGGERKDSGRAALVAVLVAAVAKLIFAIVQLSRGGWDLDAPVTLRTFLLVAAVELAVIAYLAARVAWFGAVGVFS